MALAWPETPKDAVIVQNELRHRVRVENDFGTIKIIAGVDVSYNLKTNLTRAFIVLLDFATLQMQASVRAVLPTAFPYIPGFLSFREIPAILEAMKLLPISPDLLMVDGQGIAHPRGLGIAAHLGVLTGLPAIGVAKSRLVGWNKEPGTQKGDHTPLLHKGARIGTVLRSKEKVKPLFISPGHRVDQDTALEITRQCLTKYRLPEPTRLADKLSKEKVAEKPIQASLF
ncbi:MAG: endonuclease [Alphaproteobacteria bacterium]|nr:endonuclease [Alphaproteobacteria bacterium]